MKLKKATTFGLIFGLMATQTTYAGGGKFRNSTASPKIFISKTEVKETKSKRGFFKRRRKSQPTNRKKCLFDGKSPLIDAAPCAAVQLKDLNIDLVGKANFAMSRLASSAGSSASVELDKFTNAMNLNGLANVLLIPLSLIAAPFALTAIPLTLGYMKKHNQGVSDLTNSNPNLFIRVTKFVKINFAGETCKKVMMAVSADQKRLRLRPLRKCSTLTNLLANNRGYLEFDEDDYLLGQRIKNDNNVQTDVTTNDDVIHYSSDDDTSTVHTPPVTGNGTDVVIGVDVNAGNGDIDMNNTNDTQDQDVDTSDQGQDQDIDNSDQDQNIDTANQGQEPTINGYLVDELIKKEEGYIIPHSDGQTFLAIPNEVQFSADVVGLGNIQNTLLEAKFTNFEALQNEVEEKGGSLVKINTENLKKCTFKMETIQGSPIGSDLFKKNPLPVEDCTNDEMKAANFEVGNLKLSYAGVLTENVQNKTLDKVISLKAYMNICGVSADGNEKCIDVETKKANSLNIKK